MKKNIRAVSAIISRKNKILLIQRAKNPWKRHWGTPGGKLDKKETQKKAIIREIKEELGTIFIPTKRFKNYHLKNKNITVDTLVFLGKIKGKIRTKKDEIADYKWVSPKDAFKLPLGSTNKQRILDFIKQQ